MLRAGTSSRSVSSGSANGRLRMERAAARLVDAEPRPSRVGELRARLAAQEDFAVDPEALWHLGESHDYDVQVDWTEGSADGAFDATFFRAPAVAPLRPARFDERWRRHAHDPLAVFARKELSAELRSWMKARYPAFMVPSFVVVVDRLPLTPAGKLDAARLPAPEPLRRRRDPASVSLEGKRAVLARAWGEVLGVDSVGADESFFDLGGDSMKAIALVERLRQLLGVALSPVSVFEHSTVARMSRFLDGAPERPVAAPSASAVVAAPSSSSDIAVIGMAIRFPGAGDVDSFWRNVCDGVESFTRLSDDELRQAGVDEALLADARYVPMARLLDDADRFDAGFFGYAPREASSSTRSSASSSSARGRRWSTPATIRSACAKHVGVYAGSSLNTYLLHSGAHVPSSRGNSSLAPARQRQGLRSPRASPTSSTCSGPAITVQTACSTSLVAVHLACQSLLGARVRHRARRRRRAIEVPHRRGYLYQEGGIVSPPTGTAAPFDARARGTVFGSGAGVVVLKRLDDALARRRHDPRRDQGLGGQQRRRGQGGLHRAERRRAGRGRSSQALASAVVAPDTHRLRRGARHGHAARRSHRGRGAHERAFRAGTDADRLLRDRLGEAEHRPPRRGGRRRRR